MAGYDPFVAGPHAVGEEAFRLHDAARGLTFPTDVWRPRDTTPSAVVAYSHSSGGDRRAATFLCGHLASHGYLVAALDHSDRVDPRLQRHPEETPEQLAERIGGLIAGRVPDLRFLLDRLLAGDAGPVANGGRAGLVGHSFGGWAVLAVAEVDDRVGAVVAHAPGGSSLRRPGILPLELTYGRRRPIPVMILAAEDDVPIPFEAVAEVYDRTPPPKRMFVLGQADHQHFIDGVEAAHEAVRTGPAPPSVAWLPAGMRPASELLPGELAQLFVRGLTLAHLDATLRESGAAERWLAGDVPGRLAALGIVGRRHPAPVDQVPR